MVPFFFVLIYQFTLSGVIRDVLWKAMSQNIIKSVIWPIYWI